MRINGCYALSVTEAGRTVVVGTVVFDTAGVTFRGQARHRLVFVGGRSGFGAPRGTWRAVPGDSLEVIVTFIDSGVQIAFPRFATDTVRGRARAIGTVRDTLSVFPAVAVRQTSC